VAVNNDFRLEIVLMASLFQVLVFGASFFHVPVIWFFGERGQADCPLRAIKFRSCNGALAPNKY
jgi:hypothetical protein